MSFQSLLQQAYWRGIPFMVDAQQVHKGRKTAVHEYPYRDAGWVEDLGRLQRVFRFTGHLIGDLAPVMQLALDAACEIKGAGLLIHPTLGAMQVALMSCSSSVNKNAMRVISVEFVFREQGTRLFPSVVTSTLNAVIGAVSDAIGAFGEAIAVGFVVLAAASGAAAIGEAVGVMGSFGGACSAAATDPAASVALATALPPPNADTSYGRYGAGSSMARLPDGTTVASLQAQLAGQRAAVTAATGGAVYAANQFGGRSAAGLVSAVATLIEASRATMNNPADQIRRLTGLATFAFTDAAAGVGLSGDVATVRDAMASTCRRCVLASLALASAAYQPASYDDAVAIRTLIAAAFDVEITAAGDAGDDASYVALKALRSAVIQDLTVRAAALPLVMTLTLPSNLPSLVVAYRVYRDTTRSDQVTTETGAIHPAFLPRTIQVLAS
jgi:prophage DNA circulation protein